MITEISVSEENLYKDVEFLTSITPARNYLNVESLNRSARYIKNQFKKIGYSPTEQLFEVHEVEYKNIIASYGKGNPQRVVIGAHYDVCDDQPGADDNGSGVAGLLELARLFKEKKPELKYRIDFVAYSLEEPPFFRTQNMGSYIHAKSLFDQKIDIKLMVCFEMIGFYRYKKGTQTYPVSPMGWFYPDVGNFIAVVGRFNDSSEINHFYKNLKKTKPEVEKLKAFTFLPGIGFSDHRNYWNFGYKAIMITDTANYRSDHYHKKSDTIETLNFPEMAKVVAGVYLSLINLDKYENSSCIKI